MPIRDQKLDASWSKRERKDVKSQDTGNGRVWMVNYRNPAEKDPKNKILASGPNNNGNRLRRFPHWPCAARVAVCVSIACC